MLARRRTPRPEPAPVLARWSTGSAGGARGADGAAGADAMPRVLTWDHVAEELARTPPAEPDG
jgi:hypothetical protein